MGNKTLSKSISVISILVSTPVLYSINVTPAYADSPWDQQGKIQPSVPGVQIEDARRADMEYFVSWLNSSSYAPHTASDCILAVKRFCKYVRSGNVDKETPWPDEVRWMHKAIKPNERKQPEFFTSSEVETMIKTASTSRDKAMLSVGFEAGALQSSLGERDT